MPTRGFYGLVVDDTLKITYSHSDSYPKILGVRFLADVQELLAMHGPALHKLARELQVVDEDAEPTKDQRVAVQMQSGVYTANGDWYSTMRELQGEFTKILRCGFMPDASWFPIDGLSCEWGYLLDLDAQKLEIYKGLRNLPPRAGRWKWEDPLFPAGGYYPVDRIACWDLSEVPSLEPAHVRVLEFEVVT